MPLLTDRQRRRAAALLLTTVLVLTGCGDSPAETTLKAAVTTLDGDTADLADFVGTPLVVNFFAESCPPCVAEMPTLDAIATDLDGTVAFLGVSEDATLAAAERIIEQTGVSYPIVWDRDGSALTALETLGLPTTLFVDGSGRIVESHTGALSDADLRERIDTHF